VGSHFDPDRLKTTARHLAGEHGVEKTPGQWDAEFRRLIAGYRQAAREAGADHAAGWSDERVWERIRELAGAED
jgi:hypothetical protein